jgi:hypothetical protein
VITKIGAAYLSANRQRGGFISRNSIVVYPATRKNRKYTCEIILLAASTVGKKPPNATNPPRG